MNKTKKTVLAVSGVLLAFTLFAGQAQAALIKGSIGLSGNYAPADLTTATFLDITDAIVLSADGDFGAAGLGLGTIISHNDLDFSLPFTAITPLWATTTLVDNFSFDLTTVHVESQDATHIDLVGTGIMHRTGYDDTSGKWAFGATNVSSAFTWASSQAVPEPSMLALLGLGLLGFVGARRFNKK